MKTWRCCDAADAAVKDDKCDAGIYVCDDSLDDDVGAARVTRAAGVGRGKGWASTLPFAGVLVQVVALTGGR